MVTPRFSFSRSLRLQTIPLVVMFCAFLVITSCGPAGPPPPFGTLWISIYDPEIGQPGIPCLITGTTTPCPAPPVAFAGHTASASPGGFETCFIAKEFGGSVPSGFPPAGFPACANNNNVQLSVIWTSNSTSSGWQINATPPNLQPGNWTIAWQSSLTNNKNLTCTATITAGSSVPLNSCP
jgi:hypothetical protein